MLQDSGITGDLVDSVDTLALNLRSIGRKGLLAKANFVRQGWMKEGLLGRWQKSWSRKERWMATVQMAQTVCLLMKALAAGDRATA